MKSIASSLFVPLALSYCVSAQDASDRSSSGLQQMENQMSLANDSNIDLWKVTVNVGLSIASGSSESSLIYADIQTERAWGQNELLLGAGGTYSESESVTTSDYQFGYLQYNRLLTERFYFGAKGYGVRDDLAELDYRLHLGPVWGYYLIKDSQTTFAIEAGPSYTWENQGGVSDSYVSLLFAERFDYQFSDRLKLWQMVELRPQVDDFNAYTLTAEIGLETRMTGHLSLKTFVRNIHNSRPVRGFERNDLAFVTALSYAIGGADPLNLDSEKKALSLPSDNMTDLAGDSDGNVTTTAIGAIVNRGNTESLAITADLLGIRRSGIHELIYGVSTTYGEFETSADTNVTDQNIYGALQYNRVIAYPWYFGLRTDVLHDKIADLDYRWTTGPVLGFYLIKDASTTLSFEAGSAYVRESQGDVKSDDAAIFAQEKFTHRFNDTLHVWQSLSYLAPFNDADDYVLRGEVGAGIDMGGGYSWRTSLEDVYTNISTAGRDRNDLRLKSALAFSF
jgi:putative salt-induced outer membrane protein YdiY